MPSSLVNGYRFLYGGVLAFAILGLWATARRAWGAHAWIVLSIPMWIALIHSLSYVEGRHRLMVMLIVLLLPASGMLELKRFMARG